MSTGRGKTWNIFEITTHYGKLVWWYTCCFFCLFLSLKIKFAIFHWVFPKIGVPPNHPLKNGFKPLFSPSILGCFPNFWKHPNDFPTVKPSVWWKFPIMNHPKWPAEGPPADLPGETGNRKGRWTAGFVGDLWKMDFWFRKLTLW